MANKPEKKGALENLRDKLYSPKDGPEPVRELELKKKSYGTKRDWTDPENAEIFMKKTVKKTPFFKKLLLLSGVFFALAVLVAGALFFMGSNSISAENVLISVSGPSLVEVGETVPIQISVLNKNNTTLRNARLQIRFPDDTRVPDSLDDKLIRVEEPLGDIGEGEREAYTIEASFFGSEKDKKEVVVSIEYEIDGSTAVFEKEQIYSVTISSAPVGIFIDAPEKISAGEETSLRLEIESNSEISLDNLILKASYPFGFSFKDSDPNPDFGEGIWELDLGPGEKKEIVIEGSIEAQDNEERTFRFTLGRQDSTNAEEIKTTLFEALHPINVSKPSLALDVTINGTNEPEVSVGDRGRVGVDISWRNNSTVRIVDAGIEVSIEGNVLNKSSVRVDDGGFYRSGENIIRWSARDLPVLSEINPGEGGSVSFEFEPLSFDGSDYPSSPTVSFSSRISGKTPSEEDVGGRVETNVERLVKIKSSLSLVSRTLHNSGPFENDGSIPPEVEEPTTYTLSWTISNSINDLSEVKVEGILPEYISFLGEVSPSDADVSFDEDSGRVVWSVGDLSSGVGVGRPSREVFFKISFDPSVSQVGNTPVVLGESRVLGRDNFSDVFVSARADAVTTELVSDPGHFRNDGRVTE